MLPLHGSLPAREQDRALAPSPRRKLVLATNVAESSITIDGVGAVIDSGWVKVARQAPGSTLTRLTLARISQASASQRAGRAGRTGPGRCLRLYSEAEHRGMAPFDEPEIARIDLAEALLTLRLAGVDDVHELAWLTPPDARALARAATLLRDLGAIDERGPTDLGRAMARLPLHPRLARALLEAERLGVARAAASAVAILAERGNLSRERNDRRAGLWHAMEQLEAARDARFEGRVLDSLGLDRAAVHAVRRAERQLGGGGDGDEERLARSLLVGFPDRVARRTGGEAGPGAPLPLALAGGGSAVIHDAAAIGGEGFCLVLDAADRPNQPALVRLAIPLSAEQILDAFVGELEERRTLTWNEARGRAELHEQLCYRTLVLDESRRPAAPSTETARLVARAALGRRDPALERWLARARFVAELEPDFPRFDEAGLAEMLAEAAPGMTELAELEALGIAALLEARLSPEQARRLARAAPERVRVASGRELEVSYPLGSPPHVASYLQDFFGMSEGPQAGGRPLLLHLWAPSRRPIQVTQDLAGFWSRHYPELKRQLARRYPKHFWPDDPARAEPNRLRR